VCVYTYMCACPSYSFSGNPGKCARKHTTHTRAHTHTIITASIAGLITGSRLDLRHLAQHMQILAQHARLLATCMGSRGSDALHGLDNTVQASSSLARRQLALPVRCLAQYAQLLATCLVLVGAGVREQAQAQHRRAGGELRASTRGLESRRGCVFLVCGCSCCDLALRRDGRAASICMAHKVTRSRATNDITIKSSNLNTTELAGALTGAGGEER